MLIDFLRSCRQDRSIPYLFLALLLLTAFFILHGLSVATPSPAYNIAKWVILAFSLIIFVLIFIRNYYKIYVLQRDFEDQLKDFDPNWDSVIDYDTSPDHKKINQRRNAIH